MPVRLPATSIRMFHCPVASAAALPLPCRISCCAAAAATQHRAKGGGGRRWCVALLEEAPGTAQVPADGLPHPGEAAAPGGECDVPALLRARHHLHGDVCFPGAAVLRAHPVLHPQPPAGGTATLLTLTDSTCHVDLYVVTCPGGSRSIVRVARAAVSFQHPQHF